MPAAAEPGGMSCVDPSGGGVGGWGQHPTAVPVGPWGSNSGRGLDVRGRERRGLDVRGRGVEFSCVESRCVRVN